MHTRQEKTRIDNHHRRVQVEHARRSIYEAGVPVNAPSIDEIMQYSTVPICVRFDSFLVSPTGTADCLTLQNAFSKLNQLDLLEQFNYYILLLVDLLHKFELSVWKATFTHLIRIIIALKEGKELRWSMKSPPP